MTGCEKLIDVLNTLDKRYRRVVIAIRIGAYGSIDIEAVGLVAELVQFDLVSGVEVLIAAHMWDRIPLLFTS
jgi:hypothetical protein